MADIKMQVVSGVRYRPEDAPKKEATEETAEVQHKMRTPRKAPAKKEG